jgi:hypothetical protein
MMKPSLIDYPASALDTWLPWVAIGFVALVLLW